MSTPKPTLDILIATYSGNVSDVQQNLSTIVRYAKEHLPSVKSRITLAYNGNAPSSWEELKQMVKSYKNVRITHVHKPGKGNAVLNNLASNDADIVAYMDADLATGLEGLPALVEAVRSGADVATGSRYHPQSKISRDLIRLFVSKVYTQILLKHVLRVSFTDPQCGFKAFNRKKCESILPKVQDSWFFFETELLFLAERNGLRIAEIPVTWEERANSSVKLIPTISNFLKNMTRLLGKNPSPHVHPWKEKVETVREASFA